MSKLIPFLFSTPMVIANQAGIKTQTRRTHKLEEINQHPDCWSLKSINTATGYTYAIFEHEAANIQKTIKLPASVGDIIWQRETFYAYGKWLRNGPLGKWSFFDFTVNNGYYYASHGKPEHITIHTLRDGEPRWYKRPSLFMPYAACRAWYCIANIRIQRLQDITEADAIAEGIFPPTIDPCTSEKYYADYLVQEDYLSTAVESYQTLWQSINGRDSWHHNPWVIAYTYQKCAKP